jgi:hypothetical protein
MSWLLNEGMHMAGQLWWVHSLLFGKQDYACVYIFRLILPINLKTGPKITELGLNKDSGAWASKRFLSIHRLISHLISAKLVSTTTI